MYASIKLSKMTEYFQFKTVKLSQYWKCISFHAARKYPEKKEREKRFECVFGKTKIVVRVYVKCFHTINGKMIKRYRNEVDSSIFHSSIPIYDENNSRRPTNEIRAIVIVKSTSIIPFSYL